MKKKFKNLLNDKYFGEILRGAGIVFLFRIIAAFVTLALTLSIVKHLGASQSGYYFFIISFLMFLISFTSFGLFTATLKEVAIHMKNRQYISNYMSKSISLILIGSIVTGMVLYLYNIISIEFEIVNEIINQYLNIIIISLFPFSLMFLFSQYFQARKNLILSMIMLNLGYQILMLISLYIYRIETVEELFVIFDISILFIVLLGAFVYKFKHKQGLLFSKDSTIKSLLTLSLPMMVAHIVSQVNSVSGHLFLSVYASTTDMSFFAVAMRISVLMSFTVLAVNRIVAPLFATLYKEKKMQVLEDIVSFSNKLLIAFSLPMLLIIIFFGKEILSLFGTEFIEAYHILVILAFGQFATAISGTVVFLLQMTNHEKVMRNNIIVSTLISIILGMIIVPIYGLLGVAVMVSFSMVMVNSLSSIMVYKILGINPLKLFKTKDKR